MKRFQNRKVLIAAAIVLALIIATSATFAWVTSKNTLANEFKNEGFAKGHGLVVNEPEDEFLFEIGATTPKTVNVVNTGSSPMLARVTFEEMIKLLGNNGQITYHADRADKTAVQFEVPFDIGGLTGWTEIPGASGIAVSPALPTGVKLFRLGSIYKAYYEYTVGTDTRYQLVKYDGKLNAAGDMLTTSSLEYAYYTEGTAVFNSWNQEHNYQPWGDPNDTAAYPLLYNAASSTIPAGKDKSTVNATEVMLKYDEGNFNTSAAPEQDKWFYNADDGYFYYIGVLPGGGSTPIMLTGVHLESGANQDLWQKHEYTLVVAVEGLQANKEALTDTVATGSAAGWQLGSGTLLTALEAAIDAFFA